MFMWLKMCALSTIADHHQRNLLVNSRGSRERHHRERHVTVPLAAAADVAPFIESAETGISGQIYSRKEAEQAERNSAEVKSNFALPPMPAAAFDAVISCSHRDALI